MNTYLKLMIPAFILQCITLSGQQKSAQDSIIKINQVEVIKEFEVTLEESKKVDIVPALIKSEIQKHQYNYEVSIIPVDLNYPSPEIRPLAMDPDEPFSVNRGFLFAGYGNLKNPSVNAGYRFSKKEKYNLLLRAGYDALDNSEKLAFQQYSDLKTGIEGDYLLKENMKIFGSVHINRQNRYFFQTRLGVDTLYDKAESLRKINDIGIQAGIFNPERTETSLNYKVGLLQSVRFSDQDIASSKAGLTFAIQKQRSKSTQWNIEGIAELRSVNANPDQNISHVQIKPYLTFNFSKARLTAGLNAFFDRNNTSPWPEAELLISLSANQIQAFTGTTQRFYTNDPINQFGLNPFLNVRIDELVNNVYKDIYAGVKGELSFIAYQVTGGYKISKDHGFFISDSTDFRRFSQVRDNMDIVYLSGNVDFSVTENWTLGGVLTQNFYKTKTLDKAWHLPNFESNVYMLFNALNNKLKLRGELFIMDQVNFITIEGVADKSNFRFDLNTKAEFYPIKNAGIYLNVINLLNNKFERWYGYPNVGIHMNAGISVIF